MKRSKEKVFIPFLAQSLCRANLCTAYRNSWKVSNKKAALGNFVKMWENGRTLSFFKIDYLTEINPN